MPILLNSMVGCDTTGATDSGAAIQTLSDNIAAANSKDVLQPIPGARYLLTSSQNGGQNAVTLRSGVSIVNPYDRSPVFLLGAVNTGALYRSVFYSIDPAGVKNARLEGFTIDFDPANAVDWHGISPAQPFSCAIGSEYGSDFDLDRIDVLNDPGTTGLKFGYGRGNPPTVKKTKIKRVNFRRFGKSANPFLVDRSCIWVNAQDTDVDDCDFDDGGKGTEVAAELHGDGVEIRNSRARNMCGFVRFANEADPVNGGILGTPARRLSARGLVGQDLLYGAVAIAKSSTTGSSESRTWAVEDCEFTLDTPNALFGIDFSNAGDEPGTAFMLDAHINRNRIIAPGLASNPSSGYEAIRLGPWQSQYCNENFVMNTQGAAIRRVGNARSGALLQICRNRLVNVASGGLPTTRSAIVSDPSATPISMIDIMNNSATGPLRYVVDGGSPCIGATKARIYDNDGDSLSLGRHNWTGAGAVLR